MQMTESNYRYMKILQSTNHMCTAQITRVLLKYIFLALTYFQLCTAPYTSTVVGSDD